MTYLTNLSNDDRFFEIVVAHNGNDVKIHEVNREGFRALANVRVAYTASSPALSFSLFKEQTQIGHSEIVVTGSYQDRLYKALIRPTALANNVDIGALMMWADYKSRKAAGTLFFKSVYEVEQPSATELTAA